MVCLKAGFVRAIFVFVLVNSLTVSSAYSANVVKIVSGEWHPYVDQTKTTEVEALIENLLLLDNDKVHWDYPGFYFAQEHLRNKTANIGFPYFNNAKRTTEFLLSEPVLHVKNVFIFNKFNKTIHKDMLKPTHPDWSTITFGTVAGYSYEGFSTSTFEKFVSFTSEQGALQALINGDIDVLPIEQYVWQSLVLRHYPNRFYQLQEVADVGWQEPLFLMASNTPENQLILQQFNQRLKAFNSNNSDIQFNYGPSQLVEELDRGTIRLQGTQLRPYVTGYSTQLADNQPDLVIPDGTKALVLDWSDTFFNSPADVSVIQVLQGRTHVLLLNGPHIGKKVLVENNHIRLAD